MELSQAIKERKSIRKYRPDKIAKEDLLYILQAAGQAPSWANTQCREYVIVEDSETKKKIAETLPEKNPARKAVEEAPVVIVAIGIKGISGFFKGTPVTDKGDWLMFDCALALQNLTLAAHERGLGTVHVGFFNSEDVRKILGVPEDRAVVEVIPCGYPAEQGRATPRKEVEEYVYYDLYGQKK